MLHVRQDNCHCVQGLILVTSGRPLKVPPIVDAAVQSRVPVSLSCSPVSPSLLAWPVAYAHTCLHFGMSAWWLLLLAGVGSGWSA